jgi:hypothetical protein
MARKPNYNFEKRQKELAREQKKADKAREKQARREAERAADDSATPAPAGADLPGPGPIGE